MRRSNPKFRAQHMISICLILVVLCSFFVYIPTVAKAEEERTVRVAFFPMSGYHEKKEDGTCTGMDVDYLEALCEYVNWNLEFVECESWDDALYKLEQKQVDLVGSAQYSKARAEKFYYADLSSGYTFGVIAVNGNNTMAYEDFEAMKELSYGVVKTYIRKTEFLDYLKDNGITDPKLTEFDSTAELLHALDTGSVDAMVHTLTEIKADQRMIGRFAPMPFYYISYYGNEDLMRELNHGIADLRINHPELETALMDKYYRDRMDVRVFLTLREKEYIADHTILKVGYVDGQYPFSYQENGEFKGLSRNVLEERLPVVGFTLEYHCYETNKEANAALSSGEVDFLAYCGEPKSHIKEHGQTVVKEYAETPLVLLMDKNDTIADIKRIVTIGCMVPELQEMAMESQAEILLCETQAACLNAIKEGLADAVLCSGYLAEYMMSREYGFGDLEIKRVMSSSHKIYVTTDMSAEDTLKSVLQKCITPIDARQINEYMLEENVIPQASLEAFLRANSMTVIMVLSVLVLVIFFVIMHIVNDYKKIQKLMYKDTRMDIWNLNYFFYWGAQKVQESKEKYAVVVFNISQFRRYNIIYGWDAGEKLLSLVANMLFVNVAPKREIRARHQGDRFVVLLAYDKKGQLRKRVQKMKEDLEQRIYDETENRLVIQCGICRVKETLTTDIREAVNFANQALDYAGKDAGDVIFYDTELQTTIKERHERERLLASVNINENFAAFYQPKVDIRTGKIVGAEALIRFLDPTANGAVRAPGFFISYFEQTGRVMEIDFFVLEEVCKLLRKRLNEGKYVVPVSCNFSRMHFLQADFPQHFKSVLDKYQITKDLIEVEITETLVVEELQYQTVKKTLEILKKDNIRLSIDDFGAGYSSLGIFEQIPAAVIKLDRSFLLNKEDRERQIKIMRGIVKLGEELDAQIVCEGVETEEDIRLMKEIGAYLAQGYYYSKPIAEKEFEEKLDK